MKISTFNREQTGFFSKQQLDMCYDQEVYKDFLSRSFSRESFKTQIEEKAGSFSEEQRKVLVNVLRKQYKDLDVNSLVSENINALENKNTFTIVTGHQMVAMTGPLYLIYKIAHVIRLTEELKATYSENQFVPIFWMASEDHDYDEIKSFNLFNKSISWETEQTGPVGRFEMKDWNLVFEQLTDLFKNHPESELFELLKVFNGSNYSEAYRRLINHLVGKYGVVIIDADDEELKREFLPIMLKDVNDQFSFKAITRTTDKLVQQGGKSQIVPREINLFYISKGIRERLVDTGSTIEIQGKGSFSKAEIVNWMQKSPEEFSPNVSLRPLYQEIILPNLCYVGGAGEINYWLQLKGVFDAVNIPFPILQTRNSVLWIDKNSSDKMDKLDLTPIDLFKELHILNKEYLEKNASEEVDFSQLDAQMELLKKQLIDTTIMVDSSLEAFATAESVRMEKQLTQIKDRLYKTVKGKHDKNLKTIQQLKEKLFPENGLQERHTNFFQLNPTGNYKAVLDEIVDNVQPFNSDFIVMIEQ